MDKNRREFLKKLGIATSGGILMSSSPLMAMSDEEFLLSFIGEKKRHNHYTKDIHLFNSHTGEEFKATFKVNGQYDPQALLEFNYFMRDYRRDAITTIDPKLLDYLYSLKIKLNTDTPFVVLSGYRTHKTNEQLRRHSHGVAKHSFHTKGKAVDITSYHRSTKEIAKAARSLRMGGVGQYNKSHFVHVDTGYVRHWYG